MRKSTAELWTLIPDDALAVVEIRESDDEWADYKDSQLRSFLTEFSYYKRIKEKVNYVSNALGAGGEYSVFDMLGDKTFLLSFHEVEGIEGVMYLPIKKEDKFFVKKIKSSFESNPAFLIRKQKFQKKKYNELHFLETNEILYFQEFHGVFIASFSKKLFLKTLKGKLDIKNFQKSRIAKLKKKHEEDEIETKDVNVFIDYVSLANALKKYVTEDSNSILDEISNFAQYSFLGLELDYDIATFSGFTTCSDSTINFLSVFDDQDAGKLTSLRMIPTNAITVNSFPITDELAYREKVKAYSWGHNEDETAYEEFVDFISEEVLILNLLSSSGEMDKTFVYKVKDPETAFRWLEEESTGQIEEYEGYKIGLLNKSDLVEQLHGSLYSGAEVKVFTILDDYVVLSESLPALKEYLLNVTSNNNWKHSEFEKDNFEDHFLEANYSFYINPSLAKKAIYDDLTSSGATLRDQGTQSIVMNDFLLFEFSFQGEKYYTDIVLKFNKDNKVDEVSVDTISVENEDQVKTLFEFGSETALNSKAYVVKNYLHRTREVLVQDAGNVVHMVDHEGKERWSYPLESSIVGEVFEVDVFKNQKIQYLLATSKKTYVIDRKGKLVENYPFTLPNNRTIESINLFDYEGNKNYRLVLTSGSDAFLYNVSGENLEGWNPKSFSSGIQGALNHVKVRGKDYIIGFLKDGRIDVVNRRGEGIKGFPLSLGSEILTEGIVRSGNNNGKTNFYSIIENGKVIVSNLNSKIVSETNLLGKTAVSLVENSEDVVAVSRDEGHVYFQNLGSNSNVTIEADFGERIYCQFYNISGKKLYVITDVGKEKTYLYDSEGVIVNKSDLNSNQEVSLLYSSSKNVYRIYLVDGNRLRLIEF